MGPKPSVGSSYPVSSYQPGPSPGSFPYEDMTSAAGHDYHGKHFGSSSVGKATPTTGSSDAAFKHYESKSNASYGYPANMHVPGGSAGGYMGTGFMQVRGAEGGKGRRGREQIGHTLVLHVSFVFPVI